MSIVDFIRGFEGNWQVDYDNVNVVYTSRIDGLFINKVVDSSDFDLHISNMSLFNVPWSVLAKAQRIFIYQYALKNVRAMSTYLRFGAVSLVSMFSRKLNIITTSVLAYDYARRLHSKVFYVPAPVQVARMGACKEVSGDSLEVMYMGHADLARFPLHKVFPVLVRLWREGYNYRFNIYLSKQGYKDYKSFYEVVKRLIERYKLDENVSVVVKNLSEKEKQEVFARADIFVYPAVAEATVDPPLTVLEAMGYGLCTIATDVQSLPYILKNRGMLVSRNNITVELYNVLRELMDNPRLIKEYSFRAHCYVRRMHYDPPSKIIRDIILQ